MAKFESEGARLRDLREVLCPRSAFVRSGPWPEESRSLRLRTDLDRERRATECPRFPLEEGSALLLLLLLLLEFGIFILTSVEWLDRLNCLRESSAS